jgi:serine/threonine-protein kinase RsbT
MSAAFAYRVDWHLDTAGSIGRSPRIRLAIRQDCDVAIARLRARALAQAIGLDHAATEAVATAVSEITRNILVHAGVGEIVLEIARHRALRGIGIVATDRGPGIADVEQAMRDGFSTSHGLGLGLSSARRLMDDFDLCSQPGRGTTVTMRKWCT